MFKAIFRLWMEPKKLNTRQELIKILDIANRKVPYYKRRLDSIIHRITHCNSNQMLHFLSDIPLMSKEILIEQNTKLINSDDVNKKKDMFNLSLLKKLYLILFNKAILSQSTGGTSGQATAVHMDMKVAKIMLQTFYKSFIQTGKRTLGKPLFVPGDRLLIFYPEKSYFTSEYEQHNAYLSFIGVKMVSFIEINLNKVEELIEAINQFKPKLLILFPFVLWKVAFILDNYKLHKKIKYHVPLINISGESILDCAVHYIQKIFPHSLIDSTYGSVEFGEIAHQRSDVYSEYDIFNEYALVQQAEDDCLIVTSLYQTTFPIIRYKTDDRGIIFTEYEGEQIKQSILPLFGKKDMFLKVNNKLYFTNDLNAFCNKLNEIMPMSLINCKFYANKFDDDNDKIKLKIVLRNEILLIIDQNTKIRLYQLIQKLFTEMFGNSGFLEIDFTDDIEHDYLKKYKFIERIGTSDEPVGGSIRIS